MNCEKFMLTHSSEPLEINEEAKQHLKNCHHCTQFVADLQTINNHLTSTLEVPVPDDLAETMKKVSNGRE